MIIPFNIKYLLLKQTEPVMYLPPPSNPSITILYETGSRNEGNQYDLDNIDPMVY